MKFALAFLLGVSAPALAQDASRIRWALGQFETGATSNKRSSADQVRGRHREVSRFQILPRVWRQYGRSADFTNPDTAWRVTSIILEARREEFKRATGQDWDGFWLYAMWNAPGECRKAGYQANRLTACVRERAGRFSNLLNAHASK